MPGAVNVIRSSFNVENPSLPSQACGSPGVGAGLGSGYPAFMPDRKSRLQRRQRTFVKALCADDVPGVIINHSPARSGRYLGSPSLAILPNGDFVASHDFFGPKANCRTNATTLVFASKDRGETWQQAATLSPSFWGKLFVHRDRLYLLGTGHEYGDVLIVNDFRRLAATDDCASPSGGSGMERG
jgi:hypothetical protein